MPPPPPLIAQTHRTPETTAWCGVGNPDYAFLGVQHRWADWGGLVSVGTLGLSHSLGGSFRYFIPVGWRGGYVEAGMTWLRLAGLSAHTPDEFFPLGYWNVGWQAHFARWKVDVAVGPPPVHMMNTETVPMSVLNATALPRLRVGVGYAF